MDMLSDVSWIHDPELKQRIGRYFMRKYGQVFNKFKRHHPDGTQEDV